MDIFPVIMCGGAGTRLWPASRPNRPKQFLPLVGAQTLFQATVARCLALPFVSRLVIVAGAGHGPLIARDLHRLAQSNAKALPDIEILLEPEGRDSAPAIAAATAAIARTHPDGIAAIMASDHHLPDTTAFAQIIAQAAQAAKPTGANQHGKIVTMGIVPTKPTSAYGYIRPGAPTTNDHSGPDAPACAVAAFVEKPDLQTAKRYIREGYLWNSGNFVFAAHTMVRALQTHTPEIMACAVEALETSTPTPYGQRLGDAFRAAPKISIDYAVMEKTDAAAVIPANLPWSDLGAWDAVHGAHDHDDHANAVSGDVFIHDTAHSMISAAPGVTVAAVGVSNLSIIADADSVLVCDLEKAQSVKGVVDGLKKAKHRSIDCAAPASLSGVSASLWRWLTVSALPLWASLGTDHQGWGFYELLSQAAAPERVNRRMRVQARQAYVFGRAANLGWLGNGLGLTAHGLAGLDTYYQQPDGLYRALVANDGTIIDDRVLVYDQAFALLALSVAATADPQAEEKALALLDRLETHAGHPAGGFREAAGEPFQSNPHMHLFEASLAWLEVGKDARWHDFAEALASLALTKLIDRTGSFIREFYHADWSPKVGSQGGVIDTGHQFEWAWLLQRWAKISADQAVLSAAHRLYAAGGRGIDRARNVAIDQLTDGFERITGRARLWPQTERLKAALALGEACMGAENELAQQRRYFGDALQAAQSLQRYLNTPIVGLWWDKNNEDDQFTDEPASGSTFYHLIEAIAQLRETAARL
ncbi:MAG: AGE family epimerase/isomerase [Pseudomonadota bacterium]